MIQNCIKILNEMSQIEYLIEEIEKVLEENNISTDANLLKYLINLKSSQEK